MGFEGNGGGNGDGLIVFFKILFTRDGHKFLVFAFGAGFWFLMSVFSVLFSNTIFTPQFASLIIGGGIATNWVLSYFLDYSDKLKILSFKLMMLLCCTSTGIAISNMSLEMLEKEFLSFFGILISIIGMIIPFFITRDYFKAQSIEEAFPSEEQKKLNKEKRKAEKAARKNQN